ncbi:cytochrome P450 [Tribonema minus]|uniref:Cytochrome P450 n=1 Tax=Tribonema minus TaxID=303371 RepID=A0A835Z6K7_9STRA|nr:cytochrome P450 [Tribonema minus]
MTAGVLELVKVNATPAAAVAILVACACLGLAVFQRLAPKIDKIVNDWATEYGDCYRLWLTGPGICVSDTPTMMHRPGTFSRERIAAEMVAQAGFRGLFPANCDVWKRYHRVMVPHFKRSNVKHMVAQVCKFATRLCRKWDAHAESRTAFNCMADLPLYALDNGFYFVLGRDVGALAEKPTGAARDAWIMMEALRKRLMTLVPPMRRDPAGKAAEARIDAFIKGLMDEHRSSSSSAGATSTITAKDGAEVADGETEQQCLLQYVLRVADPAAGDTGRNALSEAEVLGNMKMFFFAGKEGAGTHPVAAAAGWMLYYMALLPEVQARVRTEVEGVLAAGTGAGVSPHVDGGDVFTWEQVEKLEYLDAVMQEALRLHHAAPVMLLEAERDVQVRDVLLRRGECVTLNLQRPGLLEENFTRANEFWPDRWLIAAGRQAAPADIGDLRHAKVVGSFGLGARACPGQMMAKVLVKVAVSLIVRDFNMELAPGQGLPETTLSLANTPAALNILLSKRPGPAAPRA